jgi:diguanylate cyclase (GGDEF)-like protein
VSDLLDVALLDAIAPFHLTFDRHDRVTRIGRTFERVAPGALGRTLREVLSSVQPVIPATAAALIDHADRRLTLRLTGESGAGGAHSVLRGVVHPFGDGAGVLLLAFGADVASGFSRHGLGASDLAELDPTIELLFLLELKRALLAQHDRHAARLAEARALAERAASTDPLTGLANRRAMDRRLGQLARGEPRVYGLMQIDLDHFKAVNDRLGHAAGDHVLGRVADILREALRAEDLVARIGGDEFLLLLHDCDDPGRMAAIAERIIERVGRPIPFEGAQCRVSASIGATLSSFYADADPERMRIDVDAALYAAKAGGRARYNLVRPRAVRAKPN